MKCNEKNDEFILIKSLFYNLGVFLKIALYRIGFILIELNYRNNSIVHAIQKYTYIYLCSLIKDVLNPSMTGVQVLSKLFKYV